MKIEEISQLLQNAIQSGVIKSIAENRVDTILVSKAEAYRLYGRSNVDRWLTENLISFSSAPGKSSKKFIERTKLESVAATSNRQTYLPVADRKL